MIDWPKTAREAQALGSLKYFTGVACKHGHIAPRYTADRACEICKRDKQKIRRLSSPEEVKSYDRAKYISRADRKLAAARVRYAANAEALKKAARERYAANATKLLEAARMRYARNPDKRSAIKNSIRRAAKLNAIPPWLSSEHRSEIQQKYADARKMEAETGVKHHVDHIIPLRSKKVCGLHVPWNLRVIPAKENARKGNKFEDE